MRHNVNVYRCEILRELLKPLKPTLREASLEDEIPAITVAEFL